MARYQITEAAGPGWPGPKGLVQPGEEVYLSDSFVPSRNCMLPLDEPARAAIKAAKEQYVREYEQKLSELDPPQKLTERKRAELLKVPEIPKEEEEKPLDVVEEGETPAAAAERLSASAPAKGAVPPGKHARAADSK